MRKIIYILVIFCFLLILISCGTSADSTTTKLNDIENDIDTTTEMTTTETTTPQQFQVRTKWSTYDSIYKTPWLLTPEYEKENADDYDFEIEILSVEGCDISESGRYSVMPNSITLQIINKTEKTVKQVGSAYVELYDQKALSGLGAWIRIPYINEDENKQGIMEHESEYEYVLNIEDYIQHTDERYYSSFERCSFSIGDYTNMFRIVLYLNDGPHYVEFTVTVDATE